MFGIVLEDFLEADVAVAVGRVAGDAAHVVDGAGAAQLVEQPLGAELGVLDLVVVQVVGVRVGDIRVDRDGLDAGRLRLGQGRVQGGGVVRVEDDRVDVRGDQVTDVLELAGGVRVAVDRRQLGRPGRRRVPRPWRCRPAPRGSRCRRRRRSNSRSSRSSRPGCAARRGRRRRARRARSPPLTSGRPIRHRCWQATAIIAIGCQDRPATWPGPMPFSIMCAPPRYGALAGIVRQAPRRVNSVRFVVGCELACTVWRHLLACAMTVRPDRGSGSVGTAVRALERGRGVHLM